MSVWCENHRPIPSIKKLEKLNIQRSLEIAETCESIMYYLEIFANIKKYESNWSMKDTKWLNKEFYKQLRNRHPLKIELKKTPQGIDYFSGMGKLLQESTRDRLVNWAKLTVRNFTIDFCKHMFFKDKDDPKSFAEYVITQSKKFKTAKKKKSASIDKIHLDIEENKFGFYGYDDNTFMHKSQKSNMRAQNSMPYIGSGYQSIFRIEKMPSVVKHRPNRVPLEVKFEQNISVKSHKKDMNELPPSVKKELTKLPELDDFEDVVIPKKQQIKQEKLHSEPYTQERPANRQEFEINNEDFFVDVAKKSAIDRKVCYCQTSIDDAEFGNEYMVCKGDN